MYSENCSEDFESETVFIAVVTETKAFDVTSTSYTDLADCNEKRWSMCTM